MKRLFGLFFLALASAISSSAALSDNGQTTTQLPRNARPTHYDILIAPDAANLKFTGHVEIALDVLQETDAVTLQAVDMTFSKAALSSVDGKTEFDAPRIELSEEAQAATFHFSRRIPVGAYNLVLDYAGLIGRQAVGLFALDYEAKDGKKRALYTQFENSDARRMIPCWDEPIYKATFALRTLVPKGQMAVSNMPVSKTTDGGGGKSLVEFGVSPKMSTYLLFFAVGDFDRITGLADGTEVGVVTRKGASTQGGFALESSKEVLKEYNNYFGVKYPLPKLDNVAAPGSSQFFGAMENWGAIFTFEYDILLDPSISTQSDKQEAFKVAAHEISHQWFGDLVTMSWWDDLWLNEGFASWMEGRTTEKLHPEWNTAIDAVNNRETAMRRDALATTHPVVQKIETVEQASQAFDAITYNKGEAVIRMLEGYVGADAWRDGVRSYIKAHTYGSTVSDDLWKEIETAAKKPITSIAHDFTLQPGVPLVTVESASCVNGKTSVTLKQTEFSLASEDRKPLLWQTPVLVESLGAQASVGTVVKGGRAAVTVPGCDAVIVNAGQSGYFRTLYSPASFRRIVAAFPRVPAIDQLGTIFDSWALGLSGEQPVSDVLDLAAASPIDADPEVWSRLGGIFLTLDDYYKGTSQQARFRKFATSRLQPVFAKVGWTARPGESDPTGILRSALIANLAELGDSSVIAEARRRYEASAADPGVIPTALRKTIFSVVARHADEALWNQLHQSALAESTPLVKNQLYSLLASSLDAGLAKRALELALTEEPGATNTSAMIAAVSDAHPDLAFDFAIAHKSAVDARVDASSRTRYYAGLASGSADPAMIDKLNDYARKYLAEGSRRDTETAMANVRDRLNIRRDRLPTIDAWLSANEKKAVGTAQ